MALIVEFICELPNGVHARPASHVETLCNTFSSQIEWHNLRTLRRVNGVALCLIDHYFADLTLWPTLQRFDSGSLHDFLREQTGITLRRSEISS